MAETPSSVSKPSRQSSPRYPFISLRKALERIEQVRAAAGFNWALAADIRKVWGYGPKSSGGDQTLAALSYYGLLEDTGTGDNRKVKLTADANRYLRDERADVRQELTERFALQPKAMQNLWSLWKENGPPSDPVARSILKTDLNYSDWAAGELLAIYKENLQFIRNASPYADQPPETGTGSPEEEQASATAGKPDIPLHSPLGSANGAVSTPENDLSVLMTGGRLQIRADVDREGLERLKEILEKYEEILRLTGA